MSLSRPKLLDLPAFETLTGHVISLRELIALTSKTDGLVYGAVHSVPANLDGISSNYVLRLDEAGEASVVALFGEADYVRIDQRDILARSDSLVVRDFAWGVCEYEANDLLTERVDLAAEARPKTAENETGGETLSKPSLESAAGESLIKQLWSTARGSSIAQPSNPSDFPAWEENRRQALRHLQHLSTAAMRTPWERVSKAILQLPLFLSETHELCTGEQVLSALHSPDGLHLDYGSEGQAQLGRRRRRRRYERAPISLPACSASATFGYT
jgi:hypothetical protein